jgi:hypothetical protein
MKESILNFGIMLIIGAFVLLCFSCQNQNSSNNLENNYKVIYQKKIGVTNIFTCIVKDTSNTKLIDIGKKLIGNDKNSFVFFYSDKYLVRDITKFRDTADKMVTDGYIAEYSNVNGFKKYIDTIAAKTSK